MPAVAPDPKGARRPCAECRRLKIRCDREIPCGNCTKRGVAKLCPEGKLTYGSGRFVLAGTAELHDRIQELSMRVRKLEVALEAAYAATTADIHPLLRPEARVEISSVEVARSDEEKSDVDDSELMNSTFSMLSIEDDVRTSRFTPSHYSLWYLDGKEQDRQHTLSDPHYAPSVLERPGHSSGAPFPIELLQIAQGPYESSQALVEKLRACLPPIEVARTLVERYYDVYGTYLNVVPQSLLEEEYWPIAYGWRDSTSLESTRASSLAVLYGIFCLSTSWSTTPPPSEALSPTQYRQLAILAMSQDPLSITHIEALMLYTAYLCGIDDTKGKAWACLGMTIKLAQTLGIDRECRTWKIPEKDLQRRRRVFNELHSLDCFLSMMVGRSNYLSKGQHNTPIPQPSVSLSALEKAWAWKYRFLGEGVQALLALVLSTNIQPTYDATLALDKQLRSYNAILDPKYARDMGTAPIIEEGRSMRILFSQQFTFIAREATLLHLHRSFLNRSIMNPTGDPILGRWSISVMAAYQSACAVTRQVRLIRDHQPDLLRLIAWPNAALTAVITLGALVIKAPYSSLAGVAYQELQSGCEILQNFFDSGNFLLPILNKLQAAATTAYANRDNHPLKPSVFPFPEVRRPLDEVPLAGKTPPSNDSSIHGITPPAASQEALGSIFGAEDGSIFSTAYPLDPNIGGMNWHFLPPPTLPITEDPLFSSSGLLGDEANAQLNFGKADATAWAEFLNQLSAATGNPAVNLEGGTQL